MLISITTILIPIYFFYNVVQLKELLEVRHSVFIIGGAGTGKTQVLRTLLRTYYNLKKKPIFFDLNPKAVTTDELFGVINPATREWKDVYPLAL
ncbi:Dynein alpha chain, flagellar outer arm [Armadillidium nasatum]|uniref:Dynein alpha chain, flagellar outer arm n=1 Tax=Armadillidium nasatum TaxID=96803 RepID=A0A5N5SJU9_9CRUS|nr:Dynein alpha chain, flagellar outer arm [Armadillidium nasatum]